MSALQASNNNAAQQNPTMGEMSSDVPTSPAFAQFTPSPNTWPFERMEFASPTPSMDPTSVCELDAGRPRYHVPRFQMIADTSSANTIANPAEEPTFNTSSTGSNATTPNATAPLDVNTPMRFQMPDHITAMFGRSVFV